MQDLLQLLARWGLRSANVSEPLRTGLCPSLALR